MPLEQNLGHRAVASAQRGAAGTVVLRLPFRPPLDAAGMLAFLAARAVPGVEAVGADGGSYRRTLRLPRGVATVALELPAPAGTHRRARPDPGTHVVATLRLTDPRDLDRAVQLLRRLLDLDADPLAVDAALAADPALAAGVAAAPGIRLPGTVDPAETALRAVLGQQVSVAAARTAAARLAAALGEPLPPALTGDGPGSDVRPEGAPDLLFPTVEAVAAGAAKVLSGPARRIATVVGLAEALATGALVLDAGRDPADLRAELTALPGIGPWTAGYLAMRVLGDPDELLAGDLVVRRGAAALGLPADPATLQRHAVRWQPWRSYAALHLWRAGARPPAPRPTEENP